MHVSQEKSNASSSTNSIGFVYIFHGERYYKEALLSLKSLRKYHPNAHVSAFCDIDVDDISFDSVIKITPTSIRSKVNYIHLSPYERTLFLDTDTIFMRNVDDIFEMLSRFDFCVAHDLARKRKKYSKLIPEYAEIPYAFSEVNTGVIGFRKSGEVAKCFELWRLYYDKYYKRMFKKVPYDQPSFRVALWRSEASVYILPPEYNVRSIQNRQKQIDFQHEMGPEHLAQRILHLHHDKDTLDEAIEYCLANAQPY